MKSIILLVLLSIVLSYSSFAQQLNGDSASIQVVNNMLESLGGKQIWQNAKGIEISLDGYLSTQEVPWKEKYWLSYQEPGGRYLINSEQTNRKIIWNLEGGENHIDGVFTKQSREEHQGEVGYYMCEPTVVLSKLAKNDPSLSVSIDSANNEHILVVKQSADTLCLFGFNKRFEPIKWTGYLGERRIKRVLGPIKKYQKGLYLFEWGAAPSGRWRYIHTKVVLLAKEPEILLERQNTN